MMERSVHIALGDAIHLYDRWPSPVAIISDGAYGVAGFPGDPPTHRGLAEWYRPHINAWSRLASPQTTLWFWNTEIGWATVHPLLANAGWEFRNCHIWNKGVAHIAGNANGQTLRKFPVVSEVCVQYVKEAVFAGPRGPMSMKEWLRGEWLRSGLPLFQTNTVCGVKNAATRKYFTQDHLWYYPPVDMFEKLSAYANKHGKPSGRPYFSNDGRAPITGAQWARMRAKFTCEHGVTNVWNEPAIRGEERLKDRGNRCIHLNQKPLRLLTRIIRASTDPGDVVWEPFGGLCSAAIACAKIDRSCYSAETSKDYYDLAIQRLEVEIAATTTANPEGSRRRLGTHRALLRDLRDPLFAAVLFQA
jgi:site-specific DNA-methyltransferase (adenine-specific)